MHDFEVDDDIALKVAPALILPEGQYASMNPATQPMAFGLRMGISF